MTALPKPQNSNVLRLTDLAKSQPAASGDTEAMQNPKNDPTMTITDDDRVTFRQIADWTGEKANTLSARTFPKVAKLHVGLEGHPPLQHAPGKPTGYAAKTIARFLALDKNEVKYRAELEQRWSKPTEAAVTAEIVPIQESSLSQQMSDRQIRIDDDLMEVMAEVALQVQSASALVQESEQDRQKRLYQEAFKQRLQELGKQTADRRIQTQAAIDAEELFAQMQQAQAE